MTYSPGGTRYCKICGKEYPFCHTNIPNQYRWQDVACCKEHAALYFAEIAASRGTGLDDIPDEFTRLLPHPAEEPMDGLDRLTENADTTTESQKTSKKKFKHK